MVGHVDGLWVEVQVRTALQHWWANTTERLADSWGRQIRYGGAPLPDAADAVPSRAEAWRVWCHIAEMCPSIERFVGRQYGDVEALLRGRLVRVESKDQAAEAVMETLERVGIVQVARGLGSVVQLAGPEVETAARAALDELLTTYSEGAG